MLHPQGRAKVATYQEIFGLAAFLIGLWGTAVYIASIFRGETRPHVYTHLVWGLVTLIAFLGQLADKAGPGAWALGITAAACLFQAALALKWGEKNITRGDKLSLVAAVIAVVPWMLTDDPLLSVVLASVISGVAFFPTIRKSWTKPTEENLTAYMIANVKLALSLVALTNFTVTTLVYPVSSIVINTAFVLLCVYRRAALAPSTALAGEGGG